MSFVCSCEMNYNYNYFDYNSNLYFAPTSFNSDITNPTLHNFNFNQSSMPEWSYPNQYMPHPRIMNMNGIIITTLNWVSGDTISPCWHFKKDKIPDWPEQCLTCWHLQKTSDRQADDQFCTHLRGTNRRLGLYWSSEADSEPRLSLDRPK